MLDCLTHYYYSNVIPFKTLSALPESEAIRLMNELYADTPLGGRFKDPVLHLRDRKNTEKWLRDEFKLKGGCPTEEYPIYFVLGFYQEFEDFIAREKMKCIKLPLSKFPEKEISFTFFDSMYSYKLGLDKPPQYYQAQYHGKVFTLQEIFSIIEEKEKSQENWWGNIPKDYFPFIEAQVWNYELIQDIYNEVKSANRQ